jgi:hypothetical protein
MLLLLTLLGCDPAAHATDLCRDRRDLLDALYARYGGSAVANAVQGGAVGEAIGASDRAEFEKKCVLLGQGGHPTLLAEKAKAFFAQPDTVADCRRVVDLATEVATIDRDLPAANQVTCP